MKFKEVLEAITPTKEEETAVNRRTAELVKKLRRIKDTTIIIGGSDAKGTVIRKRRRDIDIFIAFDYKKYASQSNKLSEILQKELKKLKINATRVHGSRDYFHYLPESKEGMFEIVPIVKINKAEQALNITDISPLHVQYVKKKLEKNLASDIRLAKSLCYSYNLYGAESHVRGFSGYALEILTIFYGGFEKLIKAASKWKTQSYKGKIILDPEGYYKNKDAILFQLNEAKQESPLILIDPVQKERNVTAALSNEKFISFIELCKKFTKNPSANFFVKKEITEEQLRKSLKGKEKLFALELALKEGKEDLVGSKVKRLFEHLSAELESNDFIIKKKEWVFKPEINKAHLYFIIKNPILSSHFSKQGPPIHLKQHTVNFKKAHKQTIVKGKRIYAKVKRKFPHAKDFLESLIKERLKNKKSLKFIKGVKW